MRRGFSLPALLALHACAVAPAQRPAELAIHTAAPAVRTLAPLAVATRPASPTGNPPKKEEVSRADEATLQASVAPSSGSIDLPVPDFAPALVRFPRQPKAAPLFIVTHGAGGNAEAHCALWARISGEKAALLCIRGKPRSPRAEDGSYYPDHPTLESETFAALSELRAHFAPELAPGPVYYVGFSQGATMGSLMIVEHGREVTRLALVEGGFADWNIPRAQAFHEAGGERVLFVCGRKECADGARLAAHWLKMAGVEARVEYVRGAGHSHDARVEARITGSFEWLTAGDPRF